MFFRILIFILPFFLIFIIGKYKSFYYNIKIQSLCISLANTRKCAHRCIVTICDLADNSGCTLYKSCEDNLILSHPTFHPRIPFAWDKLNKSGALCPNNQTRVYYFHITSQQILSHNLDEKNPCDNLILLTLNTKLMF